MITLLIQINDYPNGKDQNMKYLRISYCNCLAKHHFSSQKVVNRELTQQILGCGMFFSLFAVPEWKKVRSLCERKKEKRVSSAIRA